MSGGDWRSRHNPSIIDRPQDAEQRAKASTRAQQRAERARNYVPRPRRFRDLDFHDRLAEMRRRRKEREEVQT